jgi:hypothetical protein
MTKNDSNRVRVFSFFCVCSPDDITSFSVGGRSRHTRKHLSTTLPKLSLNFLLKTAVVVTDKLKDISDSAQQFDTTTRQFLAASRLFPFATVCTIELSFLDEKLAEYTRPYSHYHYVQ